MKINWNLVNKVVTGVTTVLTVVGFVAGQKVQEETIAKKSAEAVANYFKEQ